MSTQQLELIPFSPVKSFFVHMLTRDISLKDSILDLIDNCVDGVQRMAAKGKIDKNKPYAGHWAKITASAKNFIIEDNCGGIPWELHEYAFRMGRPKGYKEKSGSKMVGIYGIGMKRAIFKIGEDCVIETHAHDKSYKVHLPSSWINNDEAWDIDPAPIKDSKTHGTNITITKVLPTIAREFGNKLFTNDLCETIATHFAFIMSKGFRIYVNDKEVAPKTLNLLFSDKASSKIRPFIYKANINDVDVFLTVGFTRPIPSSEEAEESQKNFKERYSSADAGWSVICNDRTVLYCDKSVVTGWGLSGVPQYHMQFIAISGIVVFSSTKPERLPTTTTKRGIDGNSELFLLVRDKMIEGMKIFTQYTNQWKTKELIAESKERFKEASLIGIEEIRSRLDKLPLQTTRGVYTGKQYKPELPKPEMKKTGERISFIRPLKQIQSVSQYLFDTPNRNPSQVGEKCFDVILKEMSETPE